LHRQQRRPPLNSAQASSLGRIPNVGITHSNLGKDDRFSQKGAYDLKGFEEPVRLFDVRWQDDA
jgi:class 3 adenylate cyclase